MRLSFAQSIGLFRLQYLKEFDNLIDKSLPYVAYIYACLHNLKAAAEVLFQHAPSLKNALEQSKTETTVRP